MPQDNRVVKGIDYVQRNVLTVVTRNKKKLTLGVEWVMVERRVSASNSVQTGEVRRMKVDLPQASGGSANKVPLGSRV